MSLYHSTTSAVIVRYQRYNIYTDFGLETEKSFKMADVKTEPLLIRPLVTYLIFISLRHNKSCLLYRIFVCKANPKVRLCYYFIKKTTIV